MTLAEVGDRVSRSLQRIRPVAEGLDLILDGLENIRSIASDSSSS